MSVFGCIWRWIKRIIFFVGMFFSIFFLIKGSIGAEVTLKLIGLDAAVILLAVINSVSYYIYYRGWGLITIAGLIIDFFLLRHCFDFETNYAQLSVFICGWVMAGGVFIRALLHPDEKTDEEE